MNFPAFFDIIFGDFKWGEKMTEFDKAFAYETLPDKLSAQELKEEFKKMASGDTQARDNIIVSNIRLVIDRVNKIFFQTPIEFKDLVSIGIIGLINAVDNFDYQKNVKFSTYAIKCIDNEIIRTLKKKGNLPNISYEGILNKNNKEGNITFEKLLPDLSVNFVSDIEDEDVKQAIRRVINELPLGERQIVEMYYGFYDTKPLYQQEIADILHYTRQNVSLKLIHALKYIEWRLKTMEIIEINGNLTRKKKRQNKSEKKSKLI